MMDAIRFDHAWLMLGIAVKSLLCINVLCQIGELVTISPMPAIYGLVNVVIEALQAAGLCHTP